MKKVQREESERIMNAVLACRDSILESFSSMTRYIDESLDELERLVRYLEYQQKNAFTLEKIEYSIKNAYNPKDVQKPPPRNNNKIITNEPNKNAQPTQKVVPKEQTAAAPSKYTKERQTVTPIIKKQEKSDNQKSITKSTIRKEETTVRMPKLTQEDIDRMERLKRVLDGQMAVSDHLKNFVVPSSFKPEEFYNRAMSYINQV